MIEKIHVDDLDMTHLVKEALSLPQGWHSEVYLDKESKMVTFSTPLVGDTWTNDPDKVGILHSLQPVGDFSGVYERQDGLIELDLDGGSVLEDEYEDHFEKENPEEMVKGEYYHKVKIIDRLELVDRIADYLSNPIYPGIKGEMQELFETIQERAETETRLELEEDNDDEREEKQEIEK